MITCLFMVTEKFGTWYYTQLELKRQNVYATTEGKQSLIRYLTGANSQTKVYIVSLHIEYIIF